MLESEGVFIVLEGSDGSGKTTQFKLLAERLRAAGHEVDVYDFPRYELPSSYFVQRYLNGEYGPASEVSPYTASLFYALDRFEAAPQIRQSLADGKIVLADRYTGSNMAHQGSKFTNSGEQRGFFVWADSLEFQLLGIPRPNANFFLRVPAEVSDGLIRRRNERRHEHENDIEHLRKAVSAFDNLCQLFPKDFKAIECSQASKMLPITEINNRIWKALKPLLPQPAHSGHSATVNLDEKPSSVSNKPSEPAYVAQTPAKSAIGQSERLEIKDISLLALNNLLGLPGVSVEYSVNWPPDRSKPHMHYFIPPQFPPKLSKNYSSTIDKLIDLYRRMEKKLADTAKKPADRVITSQARAFFQAAVPLSVLSDANISGSRDSIKNLIDQAHLSDLPELRQLASRLDGRSEKSGSGDSRSRLTEPLAPRQIIKQLAEARLSQAAADYDDLVKLLEARPKNEIDLLVDCLYPFSNLGRADIAAELDAWTYEQKAETLKTACREDPDIVFGGVRYRFDVIDDRLTLKNLVNLLKPSELLQQSPTPRYGYRVPEEIEQAGIDELFIECFDLSLQLFSEVQAAGFDHLAGYATLLGHRLRWQLNISGQAVFRYYPEGSVSFQKLLKLLRDRAAEVHPLISQAASSQMQQKATWKTRPETKTANRKTAQKRRGARPKK